MKRLFILTLIFLLAFTALPVFAEEEVLPDYTGKDRYFVAPYTFEIPLDGEFEGSVIEVTANVGCIRDCGSYGGYYFDRLIDYETKIISDIDGMYVEFSDSVFNIRSWSKTHADFGIIGTVTRKVPLSYTIRSPKSGLIRVDRTISTDYYFRESFNEEWRIYAR